METKLSSPLRSLPKEFPKTILTISNFSFRHNFRTLPSMYQVNLIRSTCLEFLGKWVELTKYLSLSPTHIKPHLCFSQKPYGVSYMNEPLSQQIKLRLRLKGKTKKMYLNSNRASLQSYSLYPCHRLTLWIPAKNTVSALHGSPAPTWGSFGEDDFCLPSDWARESSLSSSDKSALQSQPLSLQDIQISETMSISICFSILLHFVCRGTLLKPFMHSFDGNLPSIF